MLFNEINNFIEVYNNSVIELLQCFVTSFFGRIDNLASSVIKFRPKNSVPKHCIRSITYKYRLWLQFQWKNSALYFEKFCKSLYIILYGDLATMLITIVIVVH